MFVKIIWALLTVVNLIGAYYFATIGDNVGLELINLFSCYICWKELKDV